MPRPRPAHVVAALFAAVLVGGLGTPPLAAEPEDAPVDPRLFQALQWRNIGPFRGGRSTAVAGVVGQPLVYYFGSTGGGLWKTEDAGTTWKNVSDGFFKTGSVGAVAVSPSDPNVVYVGMGEGDVRGVTTSAGDGVYRSTDGGKTWTHLGLEKTRQVSRIHVHPQDPDVVWVAAQGNPWTANPERGVYRSADGGETWTLVLHVDDKTGASDLALDATNPRILYAAFWQHQRLPWKVVSGGEGSGIWKSVDGGLTWEELEKGLPKLMGKIGVAVSPARPERVWAIVEADLGGLFRSDDGGKTWTRINQERVLRARSWYYTKVFADPKDEDTVYVTNAPLMRSVDGGKTFQRIKTPHGDNHDLWIDPDDPRRMINSNDGGANVSWNGGQTWSTQDNQPTAQLYRVITDERFPYWVYGGQQDNSTVAIASRAAGPGIGPWDWHPAGGCESAWVAFDPQDPRRTWAGCYQGQISEYDRETRRAKNVMAYPYMGLGGDPKDFELRFNWNAPIFTSPHDRGVLYHAGNKLLRSRDGGLTWEEASPDLTRPDEAKLGPGGGPITNEAAGAETYHTIFYAVESPHEAGTIWVGTDDGLVHLTRDGGETWNEVTPAGIGEAQVNAIEVSPHDPAKAYLAVTRYKLGDFKPYAFRTADYGRTWTAITSGIKGEAFVRVVREDPGRAGLLYAGTETGMWISFDDGARWQPFQQNLPVVAITDLAIRDHDLVVATQGRAFWILDDLTPLHELGDEVATAPVHLFEPRAAFRVDWGDTEPQPGLGANPPSGAILDYTLSAEAAKSLEGEDGDVLTLEVSDAMGRVVRTFTSRKPEKDGDGPGLEGLGFEEPKPLPVEAGLNRFVWDLKSEQVTHVPGIRVFGPGVKRYRVAPGTYTLRLEWADQVEEVDLVVNGDPRHPATWEEYAEQQRLIAETWSRVDELHAEVARLRSVRDQVEDLIERTASHEAAAEIEAAGEELVEKITAWEETLVQPKHETFQDVINFPNMLNAQLIFLLGAVDGAEPPLTEGMRRRFADLGAAWQEKKAEGERLVTEDVAAWNELFERHLVPAVIVPEKP